MAKSLNGQETEILETFTKNELISVKSQENAVSASKQFRELIARCHVIASIKSPIDEITIALLWEYTSKNYGNYTFEEIEKAITYNEAGLLDERVEHFHSFSLNYLSRVMGNWLVLKTKTRQRVVALLPPVVEKVETPETLYQGLLNYINKNNSFPDSWAWSKVYQHMDECLLITENNEQKRELFEKVKAKINAKIENELLSVKGFIERQGIIDSADERAKVESRRQLIVKHLSHLLK